MDDADPKNYDLLTFALPDKNKGPTSRIDKSRFKIPLNSLRPKTQADDFPAYVITEPGEEYDPFDPKTGRTQNSLMPLGTLESQRLNTEREYALSPQDEDLAIESSRQSTLINPVRKPEIKMIRKTFIADGSSKVVLIDEKKKNYAKMIRNIFRFNGLIHKGNSKAKIFPQLASVAGDAANIQLQQMKSLRARKNWRRARYLLHMERVIGIFNVALDDRDHELLKGKTIAILKNMKSKSRNSNSVSFSNRRLVWTKIKAWHINPDSEIYFMWEIFFQLTSIYYILIFPYLVAFRIQNLRLVAINTSIDVFYACDIIIHFFVALKNKQNGDLITNKKLIFLDYLTGTLIIDVLAIIPYEHINPSLIAIKLVRILRLNMVLKYVRILAENVLPFFVEANRALKVSNFVASFLELVLIMIVIIHFSACIWISLGYEREHGETTWFDRIDEPGINSSTQNFKADYFNMYVLGIFQVVVTLTTVGYGTYTGDSVREYLFCMVLEFFGELFFAFLMYKLTTAVASFNEFEVKRTKETDAIDSWLFKIDQVVFEHRGITDPNILNKVQETLKYINYHNWTHLFGSNDLFKSICPHVKNKILKINFKPFMEKFETLFKGVSESFILDLFVHAESKLFVDRQCIIQRGTHPFGIYLILEGSVLVYGSSTKKPLRRFRENSFFGEISIAQDSPSPFSFVAEGQSKFLLIKKEAFRGVGRKHPKDMREILSLVYFRYRVLLHLKRNFEKGSSDEGLEAYINQLAAQGSVCEIPETVKDDIRVMHTPHIDLGPYSGYMSRPKKSRSKTEISKTSVSPRKNGRNQSEKFFHLHSFKNIDTKQSIVAEEPSLSDDSDVETIASVSSGSVSDRSDEYDTDTEVESNDSELNYSDVCPVENYEIDFEEIVWDDRLHSYLEARLNFYQQRLNEITRKLRAMMDSFSRMVAHERQRTSKKMATKSYVPSPLLN